MRVLGIEDEPFHAMPFLEAAPGGKCRHQVLPFLPGRVEGLPAGLDALVLTSDLQGRALRGADEPEDAPLRLLGEAVAEELSLLAELEQIPALDRTGLVLAGDLYAAPRADNTGATGDVRSVWRTFARCGVRWVVGVAGNHDLFGSSEQEEMLANEPGVSLLDGTHLDVDDLRIAGVGGIIGNKRKPNRRPEEQFLAVVRQCAQARPEVLVLHEGPSGCVRKQFGHTPLRELIRPWPMLVVCGHTHWKQPLADLEGEAQVVNTDGRVIVLRRE